MKIETTTMMLSDKQRAMLSYCGEMSAPVLPVPRRQGAMPTVRSLEKKKMLRVADAPKGWVMELTALGSTVYAYMKTPEAKIHCFVCYGFYCDSKKDGVPIHRKCKRKL